MPPNLAPFAALAPALRCNVAEVEKADGLLDESLDAAAIVQQLNCIGCGARGLAAEIARTLPYGFWMRNTVALDGIVAVKLAACSRHEFACVGAE